MTVAFPLDANTVRDYMDLQGAATSKYSDTTINSNIRTSLSWLERKTGRRLHDTTETLVFTTDGAQTVTIPGLRTATSIAKNTTPLTADSGYWLLPDTQQTGVYTGVSFGTSGRGYSYLSNPEWFDRNLDSPRYQAYYAGRPGSLPNDLVIAGNWGYTTPPEEVVMAVKILAAFFTTLADANSSGGISTPDGNLFDLSSWPDSVQQFVQDFAIGENGVAGVLI